MNNDQIKIINDTVNGKIEELVKPYVERIDALESLNSDLTKHIENRDSTIRARGAQIDRLIEMTDGFRQLTVSKDEQITILQNTISELKETIDLQRQIIVAKEEEVKIEQRRPWWKKLFGISIVLLLFSQSCSSVKFVEILGQPIYVQDTIKADYEKLPR